MPIHQTYEDVKERLAKRYPAPDPATQIPQTAKDRAFAEAAQLYQRRIAEEAAKTSEEREAEQLNAELGPLNASYSSMLKQPTRWAAQMRDIKAQIDAKYARLQALGVARGNNETAHKMHNRYGNLVDF